MHSDPLPQIAPQDVPEGAAILDVREDDEWMEVHIEGAQHLPMSSLGQRTGEIRVPEEGPLIVTCHLGGRSAQVAGWLRSQGVDAVNLAGGLDAWEAQGRAVVRGG